MHPLRKSSRTRTRLGAATCVAWLLCSCAPGSRSRIEAGQALAALGPAASVAIITAPPARFRVVAALRDPGVLGACVGSYPVADAEVPVRRCQELPDSARELARALEQRWLQPLGVTVTATTAGAGTAPGCRPEQSGPDYLLHVEWHLHHFAYQPLAWRSYDYVGGARIQLLDCRHAARTVYRGFCAVGWPTGDPRGVLQATAAELLADAPGRVAAILSTAAALCADKLTRTGPLSR